MNISDMVELVQEGYDPRVLVDEMYDELLEKVPSDPYERAKFRIQSLAKRFDDDEAKIKKHTLLRVKKTKNKAKMQGIIKAAQEFGMKDVVKAAKARMKEL